MTGKKYKKRIYPGPGALFADAYFLIRHAGTLFSGRITHAFRERLILTVTQVNACRYCSFFHSRTALLVGINNGEVADLSDRVFDSSPPEEIPALLYAQHWAESGRKPDREIREKFIDRYGKKKSKYIEYVLRSIRMANLLGNSFDYLLYRASFGRWRKDG
jgi:AhpD family alkylhydroperoxidase